MPPLEVLTAPNRLPYKEGGYNRPSQGSNEVSELAGCAPLVVARRTVAPSHGRRTSGATKCPKPTSFVARCLLDVVHWALDLQVVRARDPLQRVDDANGVERCTALYCYSGESPLLQLKRCFIACRETNVHQIGR